MLSGYQGSFLFLLHLPVQEGTNFIFKANSKYPFGLNLDVGSLTRSMLYILKMIFIQKLRILILLDVVLIKDMLLENINIMTRFSTVDLLCQVTSLEANIVYYGLRGIVLVKKCL